ncbi:hypothetical protein IHE61_25490 [Streptomyces sp. GKU 257-1]|nr:hypothetical protein [Streptomyces sp. GKU 257-1]
MTRGSGCWERGSRSSTGSPRSGCRRTAAHTATEVGGFGVARRRGGGGGSGSGSGGSGSGSGSGQAAAKSGGSGSGGQLPALARLVKRGRLRGPGTRRRGGGRGGRLAALRRDREVRRAGGTARAGNGSSGHCGPARCYVRHSRSGARQ